IFLRLDVAAEALVQRGHVVHVAVLVEGAGDVGGFGADGEGRASRPRGVDEADEEYKENAEQHFPKPAATASHGESPCDFVSFGSIISDSARRASPAPVRESALLPHRALPASRPRAAGRSRCPR